MTCLYRRLRWTAAWMTFCLAAASSAGPMTTLGLNLYGDSAEYHPFWKACGYNTLELLDIGWWYRADQLNTYYNSVAAQITRARKDGFRVYVILLSNMQQWAGPAPNAPGEYLARFNPTDAAAMSVRLNSLRQAITRLKEADGFIFFAGDPGGNSETFNTTIDQFIAMARDVRGLVYNYGGADKELIINCWAASYWVGTPTSAYIRQLWDEQIEATRSIVNATDLIGAPTGSGGPRLGISYSLDQYYRPLALTCYAQAPNPPMELYPLAETVQTVAGRGSSRQWGWPYFLVDEADGGYGTLGQPQGEVRYIHQFAAQARVLGLDGVIGNLSYAGRAAEALNTFALARCCLSADSAVTINDIFNEFAGFVAAPPSKPLMNQVLRYLENQSSWHASMPAARRLAAVDDGDTLTPWRALARLRQVEPNPSPALPLPEPPQDFLRRVRERLESLASQGETPLTAADRDGGELFGLEGGNWTGDAHTAGGLDAGLGAAADAAALVVSTSPGTTGFPRRLDQPLALRRNHSPEFIRIGLRKNASQTAAGLLYWDDVLLGTLDASGTSDDTLVTIDLPVPEGLRNRWSAFAKGPHLLTLDVSGQTGTRYFEIDALWLADTPGAYASGFTWDLARDYAAAARPALGDAGSLMTAENIGLCVTPAQEPVWTLGYYDQQPFAPSTMSFDPAHVVRLTTATQATAYGSAHVEPGKAAGAAIGRVEGTHGEVLDCAHLALFARGIGSKAIPSVGSSVSPAIIAFQAPVAGLYRVEARLRSRKEGWHAAATLYQGAKILGTRQTCYNGSAMIFLVGPVELASGEKLFLVIEGQSLDNWSEVLIDRFQVHLERDRHNASRRAWMLY